MYMGFTNVLLVGMDHSYQIPDNHIVDGLNIYSQGGDPNHFHPIILVQVSWYDPKLHNVENSYRFFRIAADINNCTIVNCTIGGKLEVLNVPN